MNTFSYYVPNKYKFFNDQDPPWIHDHIESKRYQKVPKILLEKVNNPEIGGIDIGLVATYYFTVQLHLLCVCVWGGE